MFRILAVFVLLTVGIGAIGYAVFGTGSSESTAGQYLTSPVTVGDVTQSSVATGSIAAAGIYGLAFGSPPSFLTAVSTSTAAASGSTTWFVSSVQVNVGDRVTPGQVLAAADTSSLAVQLEVASANVTAAQAKLDTDQGGPTADVVASAQDSVTQAKSSYEASVKSQANSRTSTSISVATAALNLANAERQYATDKAGPNSQTIAAAKDSVTQAELSLKNAEQNLADLKASDALLIDTAEKAIVTAQQNLASVQAQNVLTIKSAQSAVTLAQQNLADLQAQDALTLAAAQAVLDEAMAQTDVNKIYAAQAALTTAQQKITASEHQSQSQVDSAQTNLTSAQQKAAAAEQTAQDQITAAQTNLTSTRQKTAASERTAASQIVSAQASLTAAQHNYNLKVEPSSTTLTADLQAIANAKQQLASAKVQAATVVGQLREPGQAGTAIGDGRRARLRHEGRACRRLGHCVGRGGARQCPEHARHRQGSDGDGPDHVAD